jgi:hypothetical protein
MHDVHLAVPEALVDDARRAAKLPPRTPVPAVIRHALALLAGWPDSAVASIARPRREGGK